MSSTYGGAEKKAQRLDLVNGWRALKYNELEMCETENEN